MRRAYCLGAGTYGRRRGGGFEFAYYSHQVPRRTPMSRLANIDYRYATPTVTHPIDQRALATSTRIPLATPSSQPGDDATGAMMKPNGIPLRSIDESNFCPIVGRRGIHR